MEGDALALAQAIDSLDNVRGPVDVESNGAMDVHPVLTQSTLLRQLTSCADAECCFALFLELSEQGGHMMALTESDCLALIAACFDRGTADLALVRVCVCCCVCC